MYLTKRQSQLLDYLRSSIAQNGYAPSLEEIAAHFKLSSVGTVHKHLKALEDKGVIRRQWNRSRAIEVVGLMDGKARRLPMLGRMQSGGPIEAITQSGSLAVPEDMIGRGPAFVLQVRGDTFKDDLLLDGDFVVLEQRLEPQDGETVVALVDEGISLKRFFRRPEDRVELVAINGGGSPSLVPARRVKIQGVVVGMLRHLR